MGWHPDISNKLNNANERSGQYKLAQYKKMLENLILSEFFGANPNLKSHLESTVLPYYYFCPGFPKIFLSLIFVGWDSMVEHKIHSAQPFSTFPRLRNDSGEGKQGIANFSDRDLTNLQH